MNATQPLAHQNKANCNVCTTCGQSIHLHDDNGYMMWVSYEDTYCIDGGEHTRLISESRIDEATAPPANIEPKTLAQFVMMLNDARLDGTCNDEQYLAGLNAAQACLDTLGMDWNDLDAHCRALGFAS